MRSLYIIMLCLVKIISPFCFFLAVNKFIKARTFMWSSFFLTPKIDTLGNQLKSSLKGKINPNQLDIAYEPVWAIGTGLVPSNSDIEEVHNFIFNKVKNIYGTKARNIRILYGGSVNSNNISSISSLNNVSGALIGGASLKISDMKSILKQFI